MKITPSNIRNILVKYYANMDAGMTKYLAMKNALMILEEKNERKI